MRILFAGGGTGGHLMPGILIANRLRELGDEVRFLVSGRAVENSFFENSPHGRSTLALEPRGGGAPGKISLTLRLPGAVLQARREMEKFKPDLVLGIGGFVSLPAGIASKTKGIPLDLLEINSVPGKATRALRPFSRNIYCSFQGALSRVGKKGVLTGSPCRPEIGKVSKLEARKKFGLSPDSTVLLVMGGSQGAGAINRFVLVSLPALQKEGIECLHIAGNKDYDSVKAAYESHQIRARVFPFLKEMEEAYAAADLAISRGGAATVAELAASALPSVIVPYPLHRDRHQWWNGKELGEGAVLIDQKEIFEKGFESTVLPLLKDPERRRLMSQAARKSSKPDAVEAVINRIREIVPKKR